MPDLTTALTEFTSLLNIAGLPANAQPGQALTASLAPPLAPIRFTAIEEHPISLTFTSAPQSVLALIGTLTGNLPIAVPGETIPTITVRWSITDDAGNELVDGRDFVTSNGLNEPTLDVVFLPAFTPLGENVPPRAVRNITAQVTLAAAGTPPLTRDIGPVGVILPRVPFPRVLALTTGRNFQGEALIMVPSSSPITTPENIRTLLEPVRTAIAPLSNLAQFAEMLVGIDTLTSVLGSSTLEFRKADSENDLRDVVFRTGIGRRLTAEDSLSSLVYLAPSSQAAEQAVELFVGRDFDAPEGKFTLATGNGFTALCEDLHSANPTVIGTGRLTRNDPPRGTVINPATTFGDELSSVRFLFS